MKKDNQYILIKTDGTEIVVAPTVKKTKFTGEELRRMVGGSIELLHLGSKDYACMGQGYCGFQNRDGMTVGYLRGGIVRDGWVFVVNANGICEGLPINERASEQWGARLVGNVLFCRLSAIE